MRLLLDAFDRFAERVNEIARVVIAAVAFAELPRVHEHLLDRPHELRHIENEQEHAGDVPKVAHAATTSAVRRPPIHSDISK